MNAIVDFAWRRWVGLKLAEHLDHMPQTTFAEVRRMRDEAEDDRAAQRRLALEDRRAFAREFTRDHGPLAAAVLAPLIPAEVAVKGAATLARPVVDRVAPGLLSPVLGRSGFNHPLRALGAGYTGLLQGLNDRGWFR